MTVEESINVAEKMENLFEQGLNDVLRCHINHIIEKYAGWKHYPRKVKKMLKKKDWWDLRNSKKLEPNDMIVKLNNEWKYSEFLKKYRNYPSTQEDTENLSKLKELFINPSSDTITFLDDLLP